jgi:transcription elongation factor GreB
MSKAFTKESDDERDEPGARLMPTLPPGGKNYLTADGAKEFQAKLQQLLEEKRNLAADGREDAKQKFQLIERRVRQVEESLRGAEIAEAPPPPWEQVRFGATVRVRDDAGEETRYRIVGVYEADVDRDWVSWVSPIARALLNRRVGEKVKIKVPGGERALEVLEISYEVHG